MCVCWRMSVCVYVQHMCETWLGSEFHAFLPDGFLEKTSLMYVFKQNKQNASELQLFLSL